MATKSLPQRLPPRTRIVTAGDGKSYLTSKTRRRYKTPVKTRRKIAAGLRRFKLPVLTTAALISGLQLPLRYAINGQWESAGATILSNYTGYNPLSNDWKFRRLLNGLFPLVAVGIINKTGILKPVNQKLGRYKIPLRLS